MDLSSTHILIVVNSHLNYACSYTSLPAEGEPGREILEILLDKVVLYDLIMFQKIARTFGFYYAPSFGFIAQDCNRMNCILMYDFVCFYC